MRHFANLLAASLLVAAGTAKAASPCNELAQTVRQGTLKTGDSERSLADRLAQSSPALMTVNEKRYRKTVPRPFPIPEDGANASYEPLGDSGVVAISSVSGSMHCQNYKFYQRKGAKALGFPAPKGFAGDETDLCWTSYAMAGTFRGVPMMLREDDADYKSTLTLFPLAGKKWGPTCSIAVEFAPTLQIDNGYCKSGTCPAPLSDKAMQIARHYNDKSPQPDRMTGQAADQILARSSGAKDKLKILPEFEIVTSNPYTEFSESQTFALLLDGKPSLAVVGGGLFGWRDYSGVLVSFWQDSTDGLVPLAGFQIEKTNKSVKTISVLPH
jgi:hypothetical protein